MTSHPEDSSKAVFALSRLMLLRIFSFQYDEYPSNSSFKEFKPLTAQLWPCQKSPSQKIAIFAFVSTISGLPGKVLTFTLYRRPCDQSALRKVISGFVLLDFIEDIILCVTSGDLGKT
jgi:hypothetical protein